jgi:Histidine kinase
VQDSAALLRRLERDLHDGAQIRLATLAMNLGMAREKLGADADPQVRELVDAAHQGAKDALAELRNLARGIHPPALDNGLADALATLAAGRPGPRQRAVRPGPARAHRGRPGGHHERGRRADPRHRRAADAGLSRWPDPGMNATQASRCGW